MARKTSQRLRRRTERLLGERGETHAHEAGIRLKDTPSPLYQLLVLSTLLSTRTSAPIAVAAAREIFKAGWRTPHAMADAAWSDVVDALGRAHYRRYDESTATALGSGAERSIWPRHWPRPSTGRCSPTVPSGSSRVPACRAGDIVGGFPRTADAMPDNRSCPNRVASCAM